MMPRENLIVLSTAFDLNFLVKELDILAKEEQHVDFYKDISKVKKVLGRKKELEKLISLINSCKNQIDFLYDIYNMIETMSEIDIEAFDEELDKILNILENSQ